MSKFKKKIDTLSAEKARCVFFLLMMLGMSVFIIVYISITGNMDQVYTDVVSETISTFSSNKSAEINLLYIVIFLGMALYGLFFLHTKKIKLPEKNEIKTGITPPLLRNCRL